MSGSFAATVGNGRILARIGRDGSLMSLATPHLDQQLIDARIHGVVEAVTGNRSLSGKSWKHTLNYVRGTNVLRVISSHSTAGTVERRSPPWVRACASRIAPPATPRWAGMAS
jgi:hypothetical protein